MSTYLAWMALAANGAAPGQLSSMHDSKPAYSSVKPVTIAMDGLSARWGNGVRGRLASWLWVTLLLLGLSGFAVGVYILRHDPVIGAASVWLWLLVGTWWLLLLAAVAGSLLARRRMQRAEVLLAALVDDLREPISVVDLKGRFLYVNRVAAATLGSDVETLCGHSQQASLGEDDVRLRETETGALLVDQGRIHTRRRGPDVEGRMRDYLINKSLLHTQGGRPFALLELGREVGGERAWRQFQEQRDSEWRALFEDHPMPALVLGQNDGSMLAVNPAAERFYGYSAEDLLALGVSALCGDIGTDPALALLRSSKHRHSDGQLLPVEVISSPMLYADRPARLLVMRPRAEFDKTHSILERRYRDLVESGLWMMWTQDREGCLLEVNQAAATAFGRELETLPGTRLVDLVDETDRQVVEMMIGRSVERKRDTGVIAVRDSHGERRMWQYHSLFYPDGKPPHTLVLAQDITLRQNYERRLRERSNRDPLTGAYNRRHLEEFTARLAADDAMGCIILDVDHFKRYNDTHGHVRGDEMLVELARFLRRASRAHDSVVRLGGDEFLLLLPGASDTALREISNRLMQRAEPELGFRVSTGWAQRKGDESLEQTLNRADQQLLTLRAKVRGQAAARHR